MFKDVLSFLTYIYIYIYIYICSALSRNLRYLQIEQIPRESGTYIQASVAFGRACFAACAEAAYGRPQHVQR